MTVTCLTARLGIIDATANTVFHENDENHSQKTSGRPIDKQASGPHTNSLGRETKSPIQMTDFDLMTYIPNKL